MLTTPHSLVSSAVRELGVAEVARRLGISRTAVASFVCGTCRPVTVKAVESNVAALASGGR